MFENIDFKSGVKRLGNDFYIDQNIPLNLQYDGLKEDLLQVTYLNNYTIDIGWYPEFSKKGQFKIYLIKDKDWCEPVKMKCCRDLRKLEKYLLEFIDFVEKSDS